MYTDAAFRCGSAAELVWYKIYRSEAGKACGCLTSTEIPAAMIVVMSYKVILHILLLYLSLFRLSFEAALVLSAATCLRSFFPS